MKPNKAGLGGMIMLLGFGSSFVSADKLNPEQIMSLMEASRSRYQTLEAVIEVREYDWLDKPEGENRLIASKNWNIRRTPKRTYIVEEAKLYVDNPEQPIVQKEIIAGSSNRWKRLIQTQDLSRSERIGSISNKPPAGRHHGVFEAIWGLGSDGEGNWHKIANMIKTEGMVSEENGLFRLESRRAGKSNSSWLILWIDPQKEYVPVRLSMFYSDKKMLFVTQSATDWTMVNSLWVPLSYNRYLYPIKGRQEYKVLSIKMNEAISSSDLDFEFPVGTMVENQIVGARYEIRDSQVPADPANSPGPWVSSIASSSLSDQKLAEAATKAGNLALQNQKNTPTTTEDALFMHEYVWVLPGKNQYTLELSADTKTKPTLSGKTISDSPLVVNGVDDQLAAYGKLIVTLERPEGHKAFADAVLTLDFAGTKVPIHFVAAPLPE